MSRLEIGKIVTLLAEYYDKRLTESQLRMYVDDLQDLSPDELSTAVRMYRNDPKNSFFPLPAKLKAYVRPEETTADVGRIAAAKIISAISKIGPYQTDMAKEFIGEPGWSVVKLQGGWTAVCENLTAQNQPQLQAQWRDLAQSIAAGAIRVPERTMLPPIVQTFLPQLKSMPSEVEP